MKLDKNVVKVIDNNIKYYKSLMEQEPINSEGIGWAIEALENLKIDIKNHKVKK